MRGRGFDVWGKRQTQGSGTHQRWPISDHGRVQWFTLVDQATTARWVEKYNGEAANTGLITVTDRPWQAMLAEMMKTNYSIEFTAGRS
jgi:hypothetical protein